MSGNLLMNGKTSVKKHQKFFAEKGAVRLRAGFIVDCHDVVKDEEGNIIEILCTYDPDTKIAQTHQSQVKEPSLQVITRNSTSAFMTVYLHPKTPLTQKKENVPRLSE